MRLAVPILLGCAAFTAAGGVTRVLAVVRLGRVLAVVRNADGAPDSPAGAGGGPRRRPASQPVQTVVGQAPPGRRPGWVKLGAVLGAHRADYRNRSAVIALCAALVAELRAGRQPDEALARAGLASPAGAPRAVQAARAGVDVLHALRLDAAEPGRDGVRALMACWRVAEQHGPGLADAIDGLVSSLREGEEHRRRIGAELAGPRATTRLLALLPVVGIAMGEALGAGPVAFLVGSPLGRADLAAGIALELLGIWWMSQIAKRATGRHR